MSAASGGNSEPKQGQRSQSARGFYPRSTMRVPQPDIIEHFGNADAVPQLPERCLSRKAGIVRCCPKFDIEMSVFLMSNAPKTVLCIHDLPGFGRAGLSVIVPVLSALGAQAVAVPTAVLSTHTGGLGTPAKLVNPGYGPAALEHYRRLGLRFDCIYSGYLADASQAKLVEQAMDLWPDALTVVDPVMGDHGRMYRGLAPEMVPAMYTLCSRASLILPNTTEAALLLGDPMPGVTGEAELHTAQTQAQRLTRICPRVLITGVAAGRGIACVGADRATGESLVRTPMVPKSFHGTGDIFGAVLVGRLLQGNVLPAAAQAAAVFVADCLKATPDEADERLGVWLESVLPRLMQNPE